VNPEVPDNYPLSLSRPCFGLIGSIVIPDSFVSFSSVVFLFTLFTRQDFCDSL